MRKPISNQGRQPWLLPVMLSILFLGVVAFLLLRRTQGPEDEEVDFPEVPALSTGKKGGYQSRAGWSAGGAKSPASARIRGFVYDMTGAPIAGARVAASTFRVSGNRSTVTAVAESNGDGQFELKLPDGSYFVTGEREGFGPAQVIANGGEDVSLVLPKNGVVSGHVKDSAGRPITRFSIDMLSPSTDDMPSPTPFSSKRYESVDGSYQLSELPSRTVFLRVTAPGFAPALSDPLRAELGKAVKVDFALNAGCTISGVVKDTSGAPVPDVVVNAELRRGAGALGGMSLDATGSDESDASGRFVLENVPIGSLMIRAFSGEHAVSTATAELGSCEDATPIELTMSGGGGLEGTAKDAEGKPVEGAKITLSHRAIGFVNTVSDSQGRYRFDQLPPGGMRVQAMRGEQHTTTFVEIPEGERVQKDIVFRAAGDGSIVGRVTAGPTPLAGMAVQLLTPEGQGILGARRAVTAQDGTYQVTGLPDGAYAVLVGSVNQVTQAAVEKGSSVTVDIDITKTPERRPPPKMEKIEEEETPAEGDEQPR
jgi:protocatechuate 3,4-dioxygenase beta subunit